MCRRHPLATRWLALQLTHRPPSLIDRPIGKSVSAGIRVGDRDSSEGLARPLTWRFAALQHKLVPQAAVLVGIPVGPAVDRNRQDVPCGIKAARPKGPDQLLADFALHGFKRRVVEFDAASNVLISCRAAGAARRLTHVNHDWLLGCARAAIPPDAYREIQVDVGMVTARSVDRIRSQLLKCSPVT